MGTFEESMKKELQILFHALCDGLRQEVRHRCSLAHLVPRQDFSLTREREVGIASSLAFHLRLAGFIVQVDAYFPSGDPRRRPDFGIWMPASKEYIYLELKLTGWGRGSSQYYYQGAINDIDKLNGETDPRNQRSGLIALGFSKPEERQNQLVNGFEKSLSQRITKDYPHYEEIGRERVDLEGMDERSSYVMIGLWFHKCVNQLSE